MKARNSPGHASTYPERGCDEPRPDDPLVCGGDACNVAPSDAVVMPAQSRGSASLEGTRAIAMCW